MVKIRRLLTVIVLLPYFNPKELVRFCRLNQVCYQLMLKHVNFQVLIEAWGWKMTPADVEETLISISAALHVTRKYMITIIMS